MADVARRGSADRPLSVPSSLANAHKVHERYRAMMRANALAQTRDAIEDGAKMHDARLDDYDRRIGELDREMDASEMAHRAEAEAHARRLDDVGERHARALEGIDDDMREQLRVVRDVFENEDRDAHARWEADVASTLALAEEEQREFERESELRRASFEDKREEIRNQHGEDMSTMKMMYENKIKELEGELARVTAPKLRACEVDPEAARFDGSNKEVLLDYEQAYEVIRARDEADARQLSKTMKTLRKLKGGVDHWREKTARRTEEWQASHASHVASRAEIIKQYNAVKTGMKSMRDARANALRKMCVTSELAIKELTATLNQARRVLDIDRLDGALERDSGVTINTEHPNARANAETSPSSTTSEIISDVDDVSVEYADLILARYYASRARRHRGAEEANTSAGDATRERASPAARVM